LAWLIPHLTLTGGLFLACVHDGLEHTITYLPHGPHALDRLPAQRTPTRSWSPCCDNRSTFTEITTTPCFLSLRDPENRPLSAADIAKMYMMTSWRLKETCRRPLLAPSTTCLACCVPTRQKLKVESEVSIVRQNCSSGSLTLPLHSLMQMTAMSSLNPEKLRRKGKCGAVVS
jgi:hypothetical protein